MTQLFDTETLWRYSLDQEGGITPHQGDFSQELETPLWLHCTRLNLSSLLPMQTLGIDPEISGVLLAKEPISRIIALENGVLLVLNGVAKNDEINLQHTTSLRVYLNKHYVITVQEQDNSLINDLMNDFEKKQGPKSIEELMISLLTNFTCRRSDAIHELENEVDKLDNQLTGHHHLRQKLAKIRHSALLIRRSLAFQRDLTHGRAVDLDARIKGKARIKWQSLIRQLDNASESLEMIRARLDIIRDAMIQLVAEQANKKVYVLSIMSILFIPPSFLLSILGANTSHLIDNMKNPSFLGTFAIIILLIILEVIYLKRKKFI